MLKKGLATKIHQENGTTTLQAEEIRTTYGRLITYIKGLASLAHIFLNSTTFRRDPNLQPSEIISLSERDGEPEIQKKNSQADKM